IRVTPSASVSREPRPRATKKGSPPTDENDRTGEETPPGMSSAARRKRAADRRAATPGFGLRTFDSSEGQRAFRDPAGGVLRVVRQNEIRARPEDAGQDLGDDLLLVD